MKGESLSPVRLRSSAKKKIAKSRRKKAPTTARMAPTRSMMRPAFAMPDSGCMRDPARRGLLNPSGQQLCDAGDRVRDVGLGDVAVRHEAHHGSGVAAKAENAGLAGVLNE